MRQVLENLFGIEKDFFQSFFKVVFQQSVSRRSLPERLAAAPVSSKRLFFPNLSELLFHRKTGSAEPFERMGPRFGVHRILFRKFFKGFFKIFRKARNSLQNKVFKSLCRHKQFRRKRLGLGVVRKEFFYKVS